MSVDPKYRNLIVTLKTAIEASLDPICVVDPSNHILYFNLPMRSLLGVRPRQIRDKVVFCDVIKLAACKPSCQIMHVLESGNSVRLDEIPARRGSEKFRLTLKMTALRDPGEGRNSSILGAFISVRDVTGDFLVQAKYHKALQLLAERDIEIQELKAQGERYLRALKRAREQAAEFN